MRISVEKAADGTFIIDVPVKPKKNPKGDLVDYKPDLRYTAKDNAEALKIIEKAIEEVEAPDDEYGLAFEEASQG